MNDSDHYKSTFFYECLCTYDWLKSKDAIQGYLKLLKFKGFGLEICTLQVVINVWYKWIYVQNKMTKMKFMKYKKWLAIKDSFTKI